MNKFAPITILSIDPGYDRVGWAIGELSGTSYHLINCGCIETNNKADIFARYIQIQEELEGIISAHQPKIAALETLYFSKNRTTAIRASEARGIIIATLLNHQLELFEYNPGKSSSLSPAMAMLIKAVEKWCACRLKSTKTNFSMMPWMRWPSA